MYSLGAFSLLFLFLSFQFFLFNYVFYFLPLLLSLLTLFSLLFLFLSTLLFTYPSINYISFLPSSFSLLCKTFLDNSYFLSSLPFFLNILDTFFPFLLFICFHHFLSFLHSLTCNILFSRFLANQFLPLRLPSYTVSFKSIFFLVP